MNSPEAAAQKAPEDMRLHTALIEAFRIAVDSIWTHKLRTVLTLLGIIIGIASVVTVGGAIEGLGTFISNRVSSVLGGNAFIVARIARVNMSSEEFEKVIKRNKDIHPEDMYAVERKCDTCDAISPMYSRTDDVKRGDRSFFDASIAGVNSDLLKIQSVTIAEGRFVSDVDVAHGRTTAVIGSQIREELFGTGDAIGKEVNIGGEPFTVIGVEARNGSMLGQSLDNKAYIPYTTFQKKYGTRRSVSFRVKAFTDALYQATQDEVRLILRARHKLRPNKEDDFDILASSAVQDAIGQFTAAISMVVIPITLISLVVGGIVVMNIMLVTVTERTVEIGTRKSVGAKRSDILLQFLVESALLASLGGVIGVMLSYIVCFIIEKATSFPMHITWFYIVAAIFFSCGIGLISGIYPAHKASKLNPIVALMKES
jgi:putative ABC transport system permease protein